MTQEEIKAKIAQLERQLSDYHYAAFRDDILAEIAELKGKLK